VRDDFEHAGTLLLVGGPRNGERVAVRDLRRDFFVPIVPEPRAWYRDDPRDLGDFAASVSVSQRRYEGRGYPFQLRDGTLARVAEYVPEVDRAALRRAEEAVVTAAEGYVDRLSMVPQAPLRVAVEALREARQPS
jgi:hypothetical protein